jgi:hypothetical protein
LITASRCALVKDPLIESTCPTSILVGGNGGGRRSSLVDVDGLGSGSGDDDEVSLTFMTLVDPGTVVKKSEIVRFRFMTSQ